MYGYRNWKPVMRSPHDPDKWWAMASDDVILAECDTREEAQAHIDLYRQDSEAWIAKNIRR